ncbi:nuclear body protein SP140-like protein isoform X1 [Saccopteryx leptura]|uniref:nuclear body protein SP140-like protein isoform X1 n=1 Tax=Saccopteryx leptura TaxID=249018 RepID=UPI00339C5550
MASGGSDLSTRRTAENWNIVKNLIYETARQHFITHKVEISGAITGIFPFLVSLRDRGFITNELYEESKKSWNNQTPVQKVVYDVLEELEKKFDLSLLKILFSKTILKSYPDLNDILEDFRYAVHEKICHQASDGKGRAGNLHTQLSFKQETGENWYQNLTWLFPEPLNYKASPENELREQLCELRQINVKKTGAASNSKEAPESQQASEQRAQASEPAVEPPDHGIPGNSCSAELTHIKTKRPFVQSGIKVEAGARSNCNPASDTIVIPSEDSTESGGGDKPPKASTSAVKRRPESTDSRTPPMSGKKLCKRKRSHEESPKPSANQVPPGARGSAMRTGPAGEGKDCGPRAPGHRESEFRAPVSLSAHMVQVAIPAPISGTVDPGNSSTLEKAKSTKRSEEHTDTTPKTGIEIFLVTCGEMKGMLIKRRLERGGTTKCIRREDRNWFTPREFEVVGGRGKSSNWRNTIRCCGTKLKQLMEYKILPDPPRIHGRKRKDNSNICKICLDGGTLYRCKSCRNYFHGDCHIPAVETNRSSWTCTFCTIRNSASQEHHKESEVLARPVQPAEQLKCAFLLLAAYCRLENDVYVNIPHENYNEMASKCLENLRTLDNIKKKLAGGEYTEVGAFVLAMNPILQNASASQRYDSNLIEKEFKKNFREVFAVEETSHNSSLQ